MPKTKRHKEDPPGTERARGKHRYARKSGRDGPTLTPTERTHKAQLMRQFLRVGKGTGLGVTAAFRDGYDAIDWSK